MMFYMCCLTIKPILSSSFSMKYSYFLNKIITFPSASKRKATMKAPQKARKQNDDAPMLVGVYRSPSAHSCRSSSSFLSTTVPVCKPSAIYGSDRPSTNG